MNSVRNRFETILADLLWDEKPDGYSLGDLFIIPKDEMEETLSDFNSYVNGECEYIKMTEMYFIPYKGSLAFVMANESSTNIDDLGIYKNELNIFGSVITSLGTFVTTNASTDVPWDDLEGMVKCFINHEGDLENNTLLSNDKCYQLIEIVNEIIKNPSNSFVDDFIGRYDEVKDEHGNSKLKKTGKYKELKTISIDIETDGLMASSDKLFTEIPSPKLPESNGNKLFSI